MTNDKGKSAFKDRIKKIIELTNSAEKLANISGMSSRAIGQYLSGTSDPSRKKLIALANAAQVNIEWLATGNGPMKKGERPDINLTLLSLVIEIFETYEKECEDKYPPGQKAALVSALYDICLDDDYTTDEGRQSIRESLIMFLSFEKTIGKAIETEKGRDRVIKILQQHYEKIMAKEDAEIQAEADVNFHIVMKHERMGILKNAAEIGEMISRKGTKK